MRTRIAAALCLMFLLGGLRLAAGQGILIPERPGIRFQPFCVKSVRVSTTITDGVASTMVEQVFSNESAVEQEGQYLFPLPEGASVTSFSLKAGEKVLEGRVLSKDEARGIYESIVRRRRDPALLEYVGRGMFRSSVFPIPPHSDRTLTLQYAEVLKLEGGMRKFAYPLSTNRFSNRPPQVSAVTIKLKTTAPLKTVYSPSHDVSVRRLDDHTATASWEGRSEFADRDLILFYATAGGDVGLSLLTYQSGDRDGYFMLVASPRFNVPKERVLPKQIVFVLDRTGSMQENDKIGQAKGALKYCLNNLNPEDRFDVITFNESPDVLAKSLLAATAENVKRAQAFVRDIEASGGTNIDEALRTALSLLKRESGTQKMVVFLTDGLPTVGETNVETILANVRRINEGPRLASADQDAPKEAMGVRARIFSFGVGYDVNVPFLDRLAEETHADADYVRPQESIEGIVSAFYAKVTSPILANLRLAFDGAETYDVYPKELPDLFKGGQVVIAGRYRGDPRGSVKLTGYAQDHPETFRLADAFGENAARSSLIPRIWATRKIGYLLDQVRLHSNQEVVNEIVRLSKDYGIITPYTSYLADERQDMALRERPAVPGLHSVTGYDLDNSIIVNGATDSATALNSLGRKDRSKAGTEETLRSLNAKQYQLADRAPAQAQGGYGGYGGGAFGSVSGGVRSDSYYGRLAEGKRSQFGLDYLSAGQQGEAAGKPAAEPGYKQMQVNARVQAVAGRVFYRRGAIWFDNAYPSGRKVIKVQALSDAYFQVLHALPTLSKYAGVGDEVVVNLKNVAVQFGKEGKEKLTDAELKEISG